MKIFLIRHGESVGDREGRYGGDYDDALTERGIAQSAQLAQDLADKNIEAVFSSPLMRARVTAEAIASSIKAPVHTETAFRERNLYGPVTGMLRSEALEKHPEIVEALKDPMHTIEGSETYEHFSGRVIAALNKITHELAYGTVAIVTHGGPFHVLFRDILKRGELTSIGDCAYVELEKEGENYTLLNAVGIEPAPQLGNGTAPSQDAQQ